MFRTLLASIVGLASWFTAMAGVLGLLELTDVSQSNLLLGFIVFGTLPLFMTVAIWGTRSATAMQVLMSALAAIGIWLILFIIISITLSTMSIEDETTVGATIASFLLSFLLLVLVMRKHEVPEYIPLDAER